ncbi:hypothetical protein J4464_04435 [Candidatus Woesearchaeota archaeon]|nr:hypothetical protein [Candidatus Woesearchaeota archaeon]
MNERFIIIGIWILLGLGVVFAAGIFIATVNPYGTQGGRASYRTIGTGTTEQGDVSVELTPQGVRGGQFIFDLAVNTHSVDLTAVNLYAAATLEYNGKTVKPSRAPELQGHHASGTIAFPVSGSPSRFTVTIQGIANQNIRTYRW